MFFYINNKQYLYLERKQININYNYLYRIRKKKYFKLIKIIMKKY